MSSAKSRSFGLRARLTLWTSLVLATSLGAGFAWVHHGLRSVLESRNDAFLDRKAAELLASVADQPAGGRDALDAEIRREVAAYEDDGLVIAVQEPGRLVVAPEGDLSRRLMELSTQARVSHNDPSHRLGATLPDARDSAR